jgi:lipid-binding SYLF domain-containing protein
MFRIKGSTIGLVIAGLVFTVAMTAHAKDSEMVSEAHATIEKFKKADPGLSSFFDRSAGYAVFPNAGKGGLVVGGAHGEGVLFVKGKPVGKASMTQVSIGAQAGGQGFSEIIFFETVAAVTSFQRGETKFSGQVSAVALKSGASADARYQEGVAVFTATKGGLMLEASVGGQKFSFEPFATR